MTKRIQAKVAALIDNRTVAINKGENDGVKMNMKFLISSKKDKVVKDPDSGENLGVITLPKIKVQVVRVDEKYSVCETYEYESRNVGGSMPAYSNNLKKMLEPQRYVRQYATFELQEEEKKKIKESASTVSVGDLAEQIFND